MADGKELFAIREGDNAKQLEALLRDIDSNVDAGLVLQKSI